MGSDNSTLRDSSIGAVELNAQLLSQLECPVCLETCLPPIYMCCNGHIVCAKCQAQLKECSTCRASGKPTFRCVQFEKMAALVKLPCTNEPRGCKLTFNMDELGNHLPKCDFGFQCYVCKVFKVTIQELKEHVLNEHPQKYFSISSAGYLSQLTSLSKDKDFYDTTFKLYAFNDDIFWLETNYSSSKRILTRTLFIVSHEAEDALRYYYSVEFKTNDRKSEFKVFHQADVLTENASEGSIEVLLPAWIIERNEDDRISYTLKISLKT